MQYTTLGRTGTKVSRICLGTMIYGDQVREADGHAQMDYAVENGVNFFDTAELYSVPPKPETQGSTERIVGNWLAKSGKRNDIVLATKIAGKGLAHIRGGAQIDAKNIRLALEASLKNLQTDYIDLYQLHWPNRGSYCFGNHWNFDVTTMNKNEENNNFVEVLETIRDLIQEGKIKHFGLSNESAWGTMHYLKLSEELGLPRVVSIQNEYSLINRPFDLDMAEVSVMEDVGLLAWSPLARGVISGKYLNGQFPEGARFTEDKRYDHCLTENCEKAVSGYIEVAKKHGLDVCQMALAFVLQRPFTTSAIIGASNMDYLKTNIAAIDVKLNADVIADIEVVRKQYPIPF